jgi:Calcineurin-like phosphoesterase
MAVSGRIKNAANSWAAVLGLGDFQYDCGSLWDYDHSYKPSYGRLDNWMYPTVGNHEYKTGTDKYQDSCPASNRTAQNYFNRIPRSHPATNGRYWFNLGSWHFVSLNANCSHAGGCASTDHQTRWLRRNLNHTTKRCIAAFWHQPLYTGANTGVNKAYEPWWQVLHKHRADLVLNGHIHNYQRFHPMDASGNRTSSGTTEYIVGTGGEAQVDVPTSASPHPATWKRAFGFLRLRLTSTGWHSRFITAGGHVFDEHAGTCHAQVAPQRKVRRTTRLVNAGDSPPSR